MRLTIRGTGLVTPAAMGAPCDTGDLASYVPLRRLRRIDHFTSMALLAAYRALDHADALSPIPPRLGIVLGTGYGPSRTTFNFLDSIITDGAAMASPLTFSHSVHNIPAGILSTLLGAPCPQTTICQLHTPVTSALCTAFLWLADERVDSVLLGAVDETTPLLEENTARLFGPSVHPTEGAAFFLLNRSGNGRAGLELLPAGTAAPDVAANEFETIPVAAALNMANAVLAALSEPVQVREGTFVIQITGAPRA